MLKIGFIGCGNMGGALARAVAASLIEKKLYLADKCEEKMLALGKEIGAEASTPDAVAGECDYVFIGVKPQMLEDMFSGIRKVLDGRKDRFVLVSMAAGTTISRIKELAGDRPVIRIMPNLAVSVGEGMTMYCSEGTEPGETECFRSFMSKSGRLCPINEKLIDAGSAVSGCGPAYVFMFAEALADGGVYCGLPRADANLLAAQTLIGAAKMLIESGKHPGELKDAVCSPGGTTIAGVKRLEEGAFRADVTDAVIAAYEKTKKL